MTNNIVILSHWWRFYGQKSAMKTAFVTITRVLNVFRVYIRAKCPRCFCVSLWSPFSSGSLLVLSMLLLFFYSVTSPFITYFFCLYLRCGFSHVMKMNILRLAQTSPQKLYVNSFFLVAFWFDSRSCYIPHASGVRKLCKMNKRKRGVPELSAYS